MQRTMRGWGGWVAGGHSQPQAPPPEPWLSRMGSDWQQSALHLLTTAMKKSLWDSSPLLVICLSQLLPSASLGNIYKCYWRGRLNASHHATQMYLLLPVQGTPASSISCSALPLRLGGDHSSVSMLSTITSSLTGNNLPGNRSRHQKKLKTRRKHLRLNGQCWEPEVHGSH